MKLIKASKIRPTLQRMIYETNEGKISTVCCVNKIEACGEYTLCGHNIYSILEIEDCEKVGDKFEGTIKDITCPNCLRHIEYIKSLK